MSVVQSILLGALQGITEFLPVSSSGHLLLARELLGVRDVPVLYDVILHVATLAAVVVVFRVRLWRVLVAVARWVVRAREDQDADDLRLALLVVVASAVTAAVGLAVSRLEGWAAANPRSVSVALLVTAAVLFATHLFTRHGAQPARRTAPGVVGYRSMGLWRAAFTGLAQGIAVFPGLSRSGLTICAGLSMGLPREKAGEYAFVLAVPAILGALLLQLRQAGELAAEVSGLALAAGAVVAFGAGLAALLGLVRLIRRGRLGLFTLYLVPVGIVTFILLG